MVAHWAGAGRVRAVAWVTVGVAAVCSAVQRAGLVRMVVVVTA